MPHPFKQHKYLAKPFEHNGRKYPSTAQAERAMALDGMVDAGWISWYLEEVPFMLGPDTKYRVDFLVFKSLGEDCSETKSDSLCLVHAEDVKGFETMAFKKIRKLWAKYGPCELWVIKKGKVEIVEGAK